MKKFIWGSIYALVIAIVTTQSTFALSGTLGGRPANPDPKNPRSQSIFIYTLKGGQQKEDAVQVSNNTNSKQTVNLFVTDGMLTNTGAFTCRQNGEDKKDVGKWLKLDKNSVELGSGESVKVPFSVTVPKDISPGEHDGCIAFESADDQGRAEGNVRIKTRSAIRVSVTVPGKLVKNVDLRSFTVSNTDKGEQRFSIGLKNTGNVSADTKIVVKLDTILGVNAYENSGQYPILPHSDYTADYVNNQAVFWGGIYKASAQISYDNKAGSFGVTGRDDELTTKKAQPVYILLMPSALGMLLYFAVLICVIVLVFWLISRRREKEDALRNWPIYTLKKRETIQFIAEHHDIDWKKLARINSIKPPYALKKGDEIRVPNKKHPE